MSPTNVTFAAENLADIWINQTQKYGRNMVKYGWLLQFLADIRFGCWIKKAIVDSRLHPWFASHSDFFVVSSI